MNKKIITLVLGCIGCFANIAEAQNVYTMFAEKQYIPLLPGMTLQLGTAHVQVK